MTRTDRLTARPAPVRARWLVWSLLSLLFIASLGCRGRARLVTGASTEGGEAIAFSPPPTALVVSPTAETSALEAALARALEARGWVVEALEPGTMRARLSSRRTELHIAITYAPERVSIAYASSAGLEIESSTSSRRYQGWIENLASSIEDELARPAREAREAAERAEAQRREEAERERRASLESQRLATERARAEADAERERRRAAEVTVLAPRLEGSAVHVVVPRWRFDASAVVGASGVIAIRTGLGDRSTPGVAGGPLRADALGLPDGCPGFFPTSPQHTVVLDGDIPYVRIEAASAGDATLAIVAPDGSIWCNDDADGSLSPRIEGWLPAGAYHVFVGNYRGPEPLAYTLSITQARARGAVIVSAPPDCRRTLLELGHPASALMFCDGREPQCADALLRAGHDPSALVFCDGVDPACSVPLLRSGRSPTELVHCD